MKIEMAQVRNFQILKELDVDFEDNLSLIIGKNNAGTMTPYCMRITTG